MSREIGTEGMHIEFWWENLLENAHLVSQKGDARTALR
jgi:hypothetical protein